LASIISFLACAGSVFAFVHALVDVFQLVQRHHHLRLQVDQLLLQVLHGWNVAAHDGCSKDLPAAACFSIHFRFSRLDGSLLPVLSRPLKSAMKLLLRVAALVHDDAAQFAFLLAHVVHLAAHHVAQLFNRLGGEADGHQLVAQGLLCFHVGWSAVAFLVVDLVHLLEELAQSVEALERLLLQLFQLLGQRLGAALAVVVVGFVEFVEVFFGHIVVGLVGVGEAVHDGGDDDLAFADFFAQAQDLGDGGGRCADRLHHVHQAAFDALGDFNFAFAGQQFHGAHFAHVHAHGVGGAAEFASPRWTGRLRLLLRLLPRVAAVETLLFSSRVSASGVCSYTATPMSFNMEITTSSVSASTNLSGKWSEISPWVR